MIFVKIGSIIRMCQIKIERSFFLMSAFRKYRVIIAHCDLDEQRRISGLLEETKLFHVSFVTHSGAECIRRAVRCQPDLIITDTVLADMDGLEVLRQMKLRFSNIKVILLTNRTMFLNNRQALALADLSLSIPYTDLMLVTQAIELMHSRERKFPVQQVSSCIDMILAELNVQRKLKGYRYVKDGIRLAVYNPDVIRCHTGPYGLYSQLCRRHNETYPNVERCIRSLSIHIFTTANLAVLEQYFTQDDLARGHVTNMNLIIILAAHVNNALCALQNQGQDILSN